MSTKQYVNSYLSCMFFALTLMLFSYLLIGISLIFISFILFRLCYFKVTCVQCGKFLTELGEPITLSAYFSDKCSLCRKSNEISKDTHRYLNKNK